MMTEGVGDVAPRPVKIVLPDYALQALLVEAASRAEYRQYRKQKDEWSQGLQGDVVIHNVGALRRDVRPIFVGMIGEYAVCEFINSREPSARVSVDLLQKVRGDFGVDVAAFGIQMQVKTRQTAEHGNLIRIIDEHGNRKSLNAKAFVFCQWSGDKVCELLGWAWTKDIRDLRPQDAVRGKHQNIVVADWRLICMDRLAEMLKAKKELSSC
jgi:hypothetical protein